MHESHEQKAMVGLVLDPEMEGGLSCTSLLLPLLLLLRHTYDGDIIQPSILKHFPFGLGHHDYPGIYYLPHPRDPRLRRKIIYLLLILSCFQ